MADEDLRALERDHRASGAPADGARWLAARLRVGDLSRRRLEVAALCGDEASRLARPRPGGDDLVSATSLWLMVQGVHPSSADATVRRWIASGLPAAAVEAPAEARFDPVEVLAWLERERVPELDRMTILFVGPQHPVAALRLAWAMLGEVKRSAVRDARRWGAFLAAVEAWLDDPTLAPGGLVGLEEDLGGAARLLRAAIEGLIRGGVDLDGPGPTGPLEVLSAAAKGLRRAEAAAHFAAARREVASWALGAPQPSARHPYLLRTATGTSQGGSDHPLAWDYHEVVFHTRHDLVDLRTGLTVRSWGDSTLAFELSPDGQEVVVRDGDRIVERYRTPP